MFHLPKGPSRFIPTLTEVVVESQNPNTSDASAPFRAQESPEAPWDPAPALAPLSVSAPGAPVLPHDSIRDAQAPPLRKLAPGFEESVVHRVMQRVDVGLDQRLRDAIATVLSEQTRSLLPRLREEVESVVRHVVYEAVAEELAADEKTENAKR